MVMHTDDVRAVENILINKGYKCDWLAKKSEMHFLMLKKINETD
jgi:hypothetical protein